MRKIYVLFLISLTIHQSLSAQWTLVGTPSITTIRAVHFLNADTGFIADFGGGIGKTVDGGTTWTNPSSGVVVQLRGIDFIDDLTGYICGASVLLKTTDGGDTWVSQAGTFTTMRAVDFLNADLGFLAGSAGVVYRTEDAGANWTSTSLGILSDVIQLQMVDETTGYLACSDAAFLNGYVYKTTDGGDTWTQVYINATVGMLGLAVVDADTVYAGGYLGTIIKSTDGGATWQTTNTINTGVIRGGWAVSPTRIYLVNDLGWVMSTDDAGATWDEELISTGLFGIHFPTPSVGYTGDFIGSVYKYSCPVPGTPDLSNIPIDVCSGDTAIFTISDLGDVIGYTWTVPSDAQIIIGQGTTEIIVAFGSQSGSVSVYATNECGNGLEAAQAVTVNPLPVPTITFSNGVLISSEPTGNQWYLDGEPIPDATSDTLVPAQNGFYYVITTSAEGCIGFSDTINVTGVGITEIDNYISIHVYPNPVVSVTVITLGVTQAGSVTVEISDLSGRKVKTIFSGLLTEGNYEWKFNRENLGPGIYFLQLKTGNDLLTKKLILQ